MSDHTYNTSHGSFRIKKENVPACIEALVKHATSPDPEDQYTSPLSEKDKEEWLKPPVDIERALGTLGLGCGVTDDGDVIDIYLEDDHFPSVEYTLTKVIAPFVEPGSFLVFAFGGADGLWAVQYTKDPETGSTFWSIGDVVVVRDDDMLRMLRSLKAVAPKHFFEEMQARYGGRDAAE